MIDVNWEVAADGTATRIVTCEDSIYWAKDGFIWHNNGAHWVKSNPDCIFQTLTTRPTQTKTVADAVEYYGKTFVAGQWTHIRCGKDGKMFFASGETDSDNWQDSYLVCTREQFEAYVKEQEGEKWTHTYSDYGVRKDCILIHDKPDIHGQVLVVNRYDEYVLTGTVEPKPIKPTITKAEAWDKLTQNKMNSAEVNTIKQQYDII